MIGEILLESATVSASGYVAKSRTTEGASRPALGLNEVYIEMGNDDAVAGRVSAKREGGVTNLGAQFVSMIVNDSITLIRGDRPDNAL